MLIGKYEEWVKQKALKAGNAAFASMFMICVAAIIVQLLAAVDIRLVLGETVSALAGGIVYAVIMVHNGSGRKDYPSGRQSGETALPV